MDNFVGAQWTTLSTAEPGNPLVSSGHLTRNNNTEQNGQQPYNPHGVHPNPAVPLSKGWGPPLLVLAIGRPVDAALKRTLPVPDAAKRS